MTACNKSKKDAEGSHLPGSWGRFAKRLHLYSRNRQEENKGMNDTVWLYVAISFIYFFLIGMVLTILLLAPKFRQPLHVIPRGDPIGADTVHPPELSLADESADYSVTASKVNAGQGSMQNLMIHVTPTDHLYVIDPRSPIFRGVSQRWQDNAERKLRINSRFLED